jgi:hypothetical protein
LYRITAQMRAFRTAGGRTRAGAPLATIGLSMTHRLLPRLVLLVLLPAITATAAQASDDDSFPHLRPTEARLRALLNDAARSSTTVRALIDRITASDLVVLIQCERDPAIRAGGRLNFITASGGVRYVLIRLKRNLPRPAAIALLAHELQHAAEIADLPAIVDEQSLAREYARIGGRAKHNGSAITFDTRSAVDIGERVFDEVSAAAAD